MRMQMLSIVTLNCPATISPDDPSLNIARLLSVTQWVGIAKRKVARLLLHVTFINESSV